MIDDGHVGLITMAGAGSPDAKGGIMIHYYVANRDMVDKAMYNSDGEFLIGTRFAFTLSISCGSSCEHHVDCLVIFVLRNYFYDTMSCVI